MDQPNNKRFGMVIDLDKCTECGICIDGHGRFKGCPVRAISEVGSGLGQ